MEGTMNINKDLDPAGLEGIYIEPETTKHGDLDGNKAAVKRDEDQIKDDEYLYQFGNYGMDEVL